MKKIDELNNELKKIFDIFDKITSDPSDDFVDDYIVYERILSDNYEKIDEGFWHYFRNKYNLPKIDEYFENSYDLLRTVFNKCLHPFYLKLDILPNYGFEYERNSSEFEKIWKMSRFFSNNWITIISFVLMITFFVISSSIEDKNSFDYDVCMSIATGFLISLIISSINKSHKKG